MVKLKESTIIQSDGSINTDTWLADLTHKFPTRYIDLIRNGLEFVFKLHHKIADKHVLIQSLSMAEILVDLQTDPETVIAALLCGYVQTKHLSLEQITEQFGTIIPKLITGMLRMDAIHITASNDAAEKRENLDNLRKMMLAIIDDIRVVLIKLAEQTWLIRHAHTQSPAACQQIARDVMNIYAPLASRLGIGQLKWELEDLAFRHLQADAYKEIAKSLDSRRIDRENYVEQVMKTLSDTLKNAGLKHFDIMGRAKHIYSIYRKMKRKDVDFSHVYDVIAVRVLTRTVEECYAGLSCVHSLWPQIPAEFDDYISNPKPNGYRSIHTAVVGPQNKNIEVQLRTYQMHEESELGVAAHWKYKEGADTEVHFEKKIAWLRQVIEWQRDLANHEAGVTNADIHSLFDDRVYVFTPAGEIIDLPHGATPLDFAYSIHSQIGHRCRGAKVNGNIVPLTYVLNTGECIEVLTGKQPNPSRDWLSPSSGYIHTDKARHRIMQWFKQQDAEQNTHEGRATLERELKHHHFGQIDLSKLARKLECKTLDELCLGIGRGDIRIQHVMQVAQTLSPQVESHPTHHEHVVTHAPPSSKPAKSGTAAVLGVSGVLTITARCCKPVPGDSVIGYITRGRGITIHRVDCVNLKNLPGRDRLIEVDWGTKQSGTYPVDIMLKAHDHTDLLKDISALLSAEKIRMLRLNTVPAHQNVLIYFSIEISDHELLKRIMDKLSHLQGVVLVERVSG